MQIYNPIRHLLPNMVRERFGFRLSSQQVECVLGRHTRVVLARSEQRLLHVPLVSQRFVRLDERKHFSRLVLAPCNSEHMLRLLRDILIRVRCYLNVPVTKMRLLKDVASCEHRPFLRLAHSFHRPVAGSYLRHLRRTLNMQQNS